MTTATGPGVQNAQPSEIIIVSFSNYYFGGKNMGNNKRLESLRETGLQVFRWCGDQGGGASVRRDMQASS